MAWISFSALPCRKKNLITARVSMMLKYRATLTWFRACFLLGRAKDLSAPRYTQFDRKQETLTHYTTGCIFAKRDSSLLQSRRHHRSQYSDVVRSTVWRAMIKNPPLLCVEVRAQKYSIRGSCTDTFKVHYTLQFFFHLTLILLTWRIWWACNNASRWQMGFNSAFKGLNIVLYIVQWIT